MNKQRQRQAMFDHFMLWQGSFLQANRERSQQARGTKPATFPSSRGSWRWLFLGMCLVLSTNLLGACQPGKTASRLAQKNVACPSTAFPKVTALTSLHPSTQLVYFTSEQYLYALNAGNGAFRWCTHLQGISEDAAQGYTYSALSSLTYSMGRLYVNTYDGYTDAFDATTGSLLWQYQTNVDGLGINPVVAGNAVYVRGDRGTLYALNAQDGSLLWQYLPEGPDGVQTTPTTDGEDAQITTPIVSGGVVYFGSSFFLPSDASGSNYLSYLHALDATSGQKRWVIPRQPSLHFQLGGHNDLGGIGGLVVDKGKIFVTMDGVVTAFNTQNGQRLWQQHGNHTDLLILGGVQNLLYVVEQFQYTNSQVVNHPLLSALDMATGQPHWSIPAVADPLDLRALASPTVLYLTDGSDMFAYRSQDGQVGWHTQTTAETSSGPFWLNGELYSVGVGNEGLQLQVVNARTGVQDWYAEVPGTTIAGAMDVAGG